MWTNLRNEQAVNDFWQLGLALFSFFVLFVVGKKSLDVGVAAGLMLATYLEDTLYYNLLWLTKPIVFWLSNGVLIVNTGFPNHIGGVDWLDQPILSSSSAYRVCTVYGRLVERWWSGYSLVVAARGE